MSLGLPSRTLRLLEGSPRAGGVRKPLAKILRIPTLQIPGEFRQLPPHVLDRGGQGVGIGESELQRKSGRRGGNASRIEQARPGESFEAGAGSRGDGARKRRGDRERQLADPGHQGVVTLRLDDDRMRSQAAYELLD